MIKYLIPFLVLLILVISIFLINYYNIFIEKELKIEFSYVIVQLLALMLVSQLLIDFTRQKINLYHHSYYLTFPVNRYILLINEFIFLITNFKYIFIIIGLFISFYCLLKHNIFNFYYFVFVYLFQAFYVIFFILIIKNMYTIKKSKIIISNIFSFILLVYNIPLITKFNSFPALSPLNSLFFKLIFGKITLIFIIYIIISVLFLYFIYKYKYQNWPYQKED